MHARGPLSFVRLALILFVAIATVMSPTGANGLTVLSRDAQQPPTVKVEGDGSVTRLFGSNRYATSAEISAATFAPGVPVAYIATGLNFPDALSGGAAAAAEGGPVLLARTDRIPGVIADELARLRPQRIVILGGQSVVSGAVETDLKEYTDGSVTRLFGSNRYATSAEISAATFAPGVPVAYIATGLNFPDALSGGAAAAAEGGPVLLARTDRIPGVIADELARLRPQRIVILGGQSVVSGAVETDLKEYTDGSVTRLFGSNRYATSAEISAATFAPGVPVAYIATGLNFPDALSGGAAAAAEGGPVLLARTDRIPGVIADELARLRPQRIVILGGQSVVSGAVETVLAQYVVGGVDTRAPGVVTDLVATVSGDEVGLSWVNPGDSDFAGVVIRRAQGDTAPGSVTDGVEVATLDAADTSYTDTGLDAETSYSYAVFAFDEVPNYSEGATVTATTDEEADTRAPGVVTDLVATVSGDEVGLSWVNPGDSDFAGVVIRRAQGDTAPGSVTDGVEVATLDAADTSYTDTGLDAETSYSYAVFAFDEVPNYSEGATVTATTDEEADTRAPGVVTDLVATVSGDEVGLSWVNPGDSDFAGVVIRRAQGDTAPGSVTDGVEVATLDAADTSYTDTGLDAETSYSYAVFAFDEVPNYSEGATVTATTDEEADTRAPGVVTDLVATVSGDEVGLSWVNPGDSDFAGVVIRRAQGDTAPGSVTDGVEVATLDAADTSYTDTGLDAETSYGYAVFAFDEVPNYSEGATVITTTDGIVNSRVEHCGALANSETWSGATPHVLTCDVEVPQGMSLTLGPGAVVKGQPNAELRVRGSLVVSGSQAEPVVFTSVRDDSVGGDTNGDADDTSPVPGDWEGINVWKSEGQPGSVVFEGGVLAYAGLQVDSYADDRGAGFVERDVVIRDSEFVHGSYVDLEVAGPITVEGNTFKNVGGAEVNRIPNGACIYVDQGGYRSPTVVSGNTVSGCSEFGVNVMTSQVANTVSAVVRDNSVSSTGSEPVRVSSMQLAPSKMTGNTGAASTRRGFRMSGELVEDLSLPWETLPLVIDNEDPWAWRYGDLEVAEDVTVSVAPGVVVKSYRGGLFVHGSLVVSGSQAEPVVFTSVRDDSAGGDYNGDGTVTSPVPGDWEGINVWKSEGQPGSVVFEGGVLAYAGLQVDSYADDRGAGFVERDVVIRDSEFVHGSYVDLEVAGPITVEGNTFKNVGGAEVNRIPNGACIYVDQGGYRSPTVVSGNTVSGCSEFGVNVMTSQVANTVSAVVRDNSVSSTGSEPVRVSSMQLAPSKMTGNTGAASTRRGFRMSGELVEDLSLPWETLPLVIDNEDPWAWRYGDLEVAEDVTVSVAPGVVVKSYRGGLFVHGSLVVSGSQAEPVVFTSVRDDSAGGDYNGDGTVTSPVPGDWEGINVWKSEGQPGSVVFEGGVLAYAGLQVDSYADDRGAGFVERDVVIRDSEFVHGSYVDLEVAGPITVEGNTFKNVGGAEVNRIPNGACIYVDQGGYRSPTVVSGNTVSGCSEFGVNVMTSQVANTVSAVVRDNSVSSTGSEPVRVSSMQLAPSKMTGNTGAASTRRGFRMSGELVEDLSLPWETLPLVIDNEDPWAWRYGDLEVAEDVTVSVAPGVVVKSYRGGLFVHGSLVVSGSQAEPVVFTSVRDDSAGGDYNGDGTVTSPVPGDWEGIETMGTGSFQLKGTRIRFATTALNVNGAPGSFITGAISDCLTGITASVLTDARAVQWGNDAGPGIDGNPAVEGGNVSFYPWVGAPSPVPFATPPSPVSPPPGPCPDFLFLGMRGSGESGSDGLGPNIEQVYNSFSGNWIGQEVPDGTTFGAIGIPYEANPIPILGSDDQSSWGRLNDVANYAPGAWDGSVRLIIQIQDSVERCGDSGQQLVLAGYSQGAWAVHSALVYLNEADPELLTHISGVALQANPLRSESISFENVGIAEQNNGVAATFIGFSILSFNDLIQDSALAGFPKVPNVALNDFSYPASLVPRTVELCDSGDAVCDTGSFLGFPEILTLDSSLSQGVSTHTTYSSPSLRSLGARLQAISLGI